MAGLVRAAFNDVIVTVTIAMMMASKAAEINSRGWNPML